MGENLRISSRQFVVSWYSEDEWFGVSPLPFYRGPHIRLRRSTGWNLGNVLESKPLNRRSFVIFMELARALMTPVTLSEKWRHPVSVRRNTKSEKCLGNGVTLMTPVTLTFTAVAIGAMGVKGVACCL